MPEEKVTCRYCGSEEVGELNVGPLTIPICERHRAELAERMVRDLDRVMGHPVHNEKPVDRPRPAGPVAPDGSKADPSF